MSKENKKQNYVNAGYVAYDTETTGLSDKATVLTAAFIFLDKNLNYLDVKDYAIELPMHAEITVTPKAMEVNGINLVEHANNPKAVSFLKINEELSEKFGGDRRWTSIGQNFSFDLEKLNSKLPFMKEHVSRHGIDTCSNHVTLKALGAVPEDIGNSLSDIAKYYGFNVSGAHSALFDTKLSIAVLKKQLIAFRSLGIDKSVSASTQLNLAE